MSLSADEAADQTPAPPEVEPEEARLPGGRYLLLLLLLVTSYIVSAVVAGRPAAIVSAVLYTLVLLLALHTSRHPDVSWLLRIALLVGTVAAVALAAVGTDITTGMAALWFALVLAITIGVVVRRVLLDPVVTIQTIFGALSAYIMIGLMYAAVYGAMNRLSSQSFFVNPEAANTNTIQYFSFTTLTTLGYGDFTAAGNAARAIATLEALTGQIFLATLVARLVASYVPTERARKQSGVGRRHR